MIRTLHLLRKLTCSFTLTILSSEQQSAPVITCASEQSFLWFYLLRVKSICSTKSWYLGVALTLCIYILLVEECVNNGQTV